MSWLQILWNLAHEKSVKSCVAYLTKKNKNSPCSPALASARIAPKISQDQQQTMCSECPKFRGKPVFDRPGDARPIKSKYYHPVSYSVPCYLLIAWQTGGVSVTLSWIIFFSNRDFNFKWDHACHLLLSGLSQFPFNSAAKMAPRMHQNSPFWAQKSKYFLKMGHSPFPDLSFSAYGDTPSPAHTLWWWPKN